MGKSKTSRYLAANPEARRKRLKYQAKVNKRPSEVKKRVELTRIARKKGVYGNGDGLDISHRSDGSTTMEKASTNRARNRGKLKAKK